MNSLPGVTQPLSLYQHIMSLKYQSIFKVPWIDHYWCYNCYIPYTAGTRDEFLTILVSTTNSVSQSHNGRLPNPDRRGHVSPHPTKTSTNQKKTIPSLTYSTKILNAYTEMAKLLQRAPEMPVTPQVPAPPQRVETLTQIEQPIENPSPQIPARPHRVEINNQQKIRKIR